MAHAASTSSLHKNHHPSVLEAWSKQLSLGKLHRGTANRPPGTGEGVNRRGEQTHPLHLNKVMRTSGESFHSGRSRPKKLKRDGSMGKEIFPRIMSIGSFQAMQIYQNQTGSSSGLNHSKSSANIRKIGRYKSEVDFAIKNLAQAPLYSSNSMSFDKM